MPPPAQRIPAPERLTILTCIGCGAMSVPGRCPGGCGPERKLELVAAADLDAVIELDRRTERRAAALAAVLTRFLALPGDESPAELSGPARAALAPHEHEWPAAAAALTAEPDPVVSWWCERCGGLDAPAPCLGVCIRRPAQWASLEALERRRAVTAAHLRDEQRLARAVRALALTRPRPGSERRHWRALRELAARTLAGQEQPHE